MAQAIKKQSKTTIKEEGGTWPLNLMVFLNAAPGADKINIVYYDLSKKNEQVDFAEVGRQARPEDRPAQRPGGVEGEGLRQRAPVRHPRDAPDRRQGKGLRESDDHAEVTRFLIARLALARGAASCTGAAIARARRRQHYRNPDLLGGRARRPISSAA